MTVNDLRLTSQLHHHLHKLGLTAEPEGDHISIREPGGWEHCSWRTVEECLAWVAGVDQREQVLDMLDHWLLRPDTKAIITADQVELYEADRLVVAVKGPASEVLRVALMQRMTDEWRIDGAGR